MSELKILTKINDLDLIEPWCAWKFGRGRQDTRFMKNEPVLDAIVACLELEEIDIRHETACAVTNMLTSCQIHPNIILHCLWFVSVPKSTQTLSYIIGIGVFPQIAWSLLTHNCIASTKIFLGVANAGLTNVRLFNVLLLPKHVLFKNPWHDPMSSAFNPLLYQWHCDIYPFHYHTANCKDDKASTLS